MAPITASRTARLAPLAYLWAVAALVLVVPVGACGAQPPSAAQPNSGAIAAQSKKIVILYSVDRNFEPGARWGKEIRFELGRQSPWPLDIQEQSLATPQGSNDATDAKFAQYLEALNAQRPPDLIVAMGAPAARFVQQHRTDLYPATPMLLAAVDMRRVEPSLLSEQDAVIGERFGQAPLVENILRLLPETKAIAVIIGKSPNERFWVDELKRVLGPLSENKVELIFYSEQPFETILKEVAHLPPHTAILFQQLWRDGTGAVYGDKEPLKRIYEVANAPIFTFDQSFFNGEVVGGPMFSPAEGARPTAAAAVRMLRGEKLGGTTFPSIDFSTPKYDWRLLQRWNISESRLPPGSEVLFREPTIWRRYFWQIVIVFAVLLLQAGLIWVLLRERRRRRSAEVQSLQRMNELAHVNRFSMAGELTASLTHEMNQPLGAILANAQTADTILNSPYLDVAELKDIVKDILQDDRRAAEVIRRMRSFLTKAPFEQKKLNLNDVVQEAIKFLSALAAGRNVELNSFITPRALPISGDGIQLQQVILNLVVNGIDAMADTPTEKRIISIRTSCVERFAELTVSDSGPGIPEDKLKEIFEPFYTSKVEGMGMGLAIARTIIEAHQGLMWAKNRGSGGVSLQIRLPLSNEAKGPAASAAGQ